MMFLAAQTTLLATLTPPRRWMTAAALMDWCTTSTAMGMAMVMSKWEPHVHLLPQQECPSCLETATTPIQQCTQEPREQGVGVDNNCNGVIDPAEEAPRPVLKM